jgi:hypothetical protein
LDQLIIGGVLAMGGAAASQAAGILTAVNSGRRRTHDSAARRVAEREARRRTLYEELLRTVDDALQHCAEMSQACSRLDPADPALGGLAGGLAERFDPLRTVAVGVMIDGSARAGQIATTITEALREFTRALKAAAKVPGAEGRDQAASRLSDLTALLGKAERELIAAARADFGVPD